MHDHVVLPSSDPEAQALGWLITLSKLKPHTRESALCTERDPLPCFPIPSFQKSLHPSHGAILKRLCNPKGFTAPQLHAAFY